MTFTACPTCERKSECERDRRCNRPHSAERAIKECEVSIHHLRAAIRRMAEAVDYLEKELKANSP